MEKQGAHVHATKTHLRATRIIVRGGQVKYKIISLNTECGRRENNNTENLNIFNKEVKAYGREKCCSRCLKRYDALMVEYKHQKTKLTEV